MGDKIKMIFIGGSLLGIVVALLYFQKQGAVQKKLVAVEEQFLTQKTGEPFWSSGIGKAIRGRRFGRNSFCPPTERQNWSERRTASPSASRYLILWMQTMC